MTSKVLSVLGSTGQIGTLTLQIARTRDYRVRAIAGGNNRDKLLEQVQEFRPEVVSCGEKIYSFVREHCSSFTRVFCGDDGNCQIARLAVDTVISTIPGFAGVRCSLEAIANGQRTGLANKETLAIAGPLVTESRRKSGALIIPLDSEHSALFQCLMGESRESVESLVITASGGPFRKGPKDLSAVSPEEALKHPVWSLGARVAVNTASLFGKGMEVLEAHQLYEVPFERIEVWVHPEARVHGLVRFKDGSLKAILSEPDMRIPILYCIEYPDRVQSGAPRFDFPSALTFSEPDHGRFPLLRMAYEVGKMGGLNPAVFNAADEVAVEAFLKRIIRFTDIPHIVEQTVGEGITGHVTWKNILETDQAARVKALAVISAIRTERGETTIDQRPIGEYGGEYRLTPGSDGQIASKKPSQTGRHGRRT